MRFPALRRKSLHRQVLQLALPMVLSNITVPLLGLVDAGVIGHLEHPFYLGGVALGNTTITVLFFLLGFLRMSTTGLNAQAYGKNNKQQQVNILLQGCLIALGLSSIILILNTFLSEWIFSLNDASEQIKQYALQYLNIRIDAAPAALTNMVLIGWLLGNQNVRYPMLLLIFTNTINMILDTYLVLFLHMKVAGVAMASNVADYSALGMGLYFVSKEWKRLQLPKISLTRSPVFLNINRFIKINRDIFLRSLCLQAVFAFMTFHGTTLGDNIAAANAVLINFLMLIAYLMDGFAYSTEALVGKSVGARDIKALEAILVVTAFWAVIGAFLLTLLFTFAGTSIIELVTSIESVRQQAKLFWPWLLAFPLLSMWCFLLDGVFVGATRSREMRDSTFISSLFFFTIALAFNRYGNHALWAAMLMFMAARAISLGIIFVRLWRRNVFLPY